MSRPIVSIFQFHVLRKQTAILRSKQLLLFILLCVVQIIVIILLARIVYRKTNKFTHFSHKVWIEPMIGNSLQFPIIPHLQYYYEPAPFFERVQELSFLGLQGTVIQTFNADGLNERYEYPIKKSDGVYRIVTVGDSFTEGLFVDTKDNYPEQLEDILNNSLQCQTYSKFEVINLGVSGYDMQYSLERFRKKGVVYRPDLVIYLTGEDDYNFSNELLRGKMLAYDQALQPIMGDTLEAQIASWTAAYKELSQEQNDVQNKMIQSELGYLTEFINIVPDRLLIMPYQQFNPLLEKKIKQLISFHSNAYYVPFEKDYDRFIDFHPTPVGHTYLARTLYKNIARLGFISCDETNK